MRKKRSIAKTQEKILLAIKKLENIGKNVTIAAIALHVGCTKQNLRGHYLKFIKDSCKIYIPAQTRNPARYQKVTKDQTEWLRQWDKYDQKALGNDPAFLKTNGGSEFICSAPKSVGTY